MSLVEAYALEKNEKELTQAVRKVTKYYEKQASAKHEHKYM